MQTRNKKYSVNVNLLKLKGTIEGDDLSNLSKSSESFALNNIEKRENLKNKPLSRNRENHLPGEKLKVSNKVQSKTDTRIVLQSKENLDEKVLGFPENENYDLQRRKLRGRNENKENIISVVSKNEKENTNFPQRTITLRKRGKRNEEESMVLNKKGNVKESQIFTLKKKQSDASKSLLIRKKQSNSKENNSVLEKEQSRFLKSSILRRNRSSSKENFNSLDKKEIKVWNSSLYSEKQSNSGGDPPLFENKISPVLGRKSSNSNQSNVSKSLSLSENQSSSETNNTVLEKEESKALKSLIISRNGSNSKENSNTLDNKGELNVSNSLMCSEKRSISEVNPSLLEEEKLIISKSPILHRKKIYSKNSSAIIDNKQSYISKSPVLRRKRFNFEGDPFLLEKEEVSKISTFRRKLPSSEENSSVTEEEPEFPQTPIADQKQSNSDQNLSVVENEESKDSNFSNQGGETSTKENLCKEVETKIKNSSTLRRKGIGDELNYCRRLRDKTSLKKRPVEDKKIETKTKMIKNKIPNLRKKSSQESNSDDKTLLNNVVDKINESAETRNTNPKITELKKRRYSGNKTDRTLRTIKRKNILKEETVSNDEGKTNVLPAKKNIKTKSQEKIPIWKSKEITKNTESDSPLFDFKTRRKSKRISLGRHKDVYEFPFEGNEKCVLKKKRRKQQVRKKKPIKPLKKGLLTTDPLFKPTIPFAISAKTFYSSKVAKSNSRKSNISKDIENHVNDNTDIDGDDTNFDNGPVDDDGYEASISVANDTDGPSMSFTNPVLSVLPTPKLCSRFPGPSSTPIVNDERYEYNSYININNKPQAPQEEVKLCFGFDESEDEDTSIGLSPVKKIQQLSLLHQASILTSSNVEEIDPVPTRFTLPLFKKPLPLLKGKENYTQLNRNNRSTLPKLNYSKQKLNKNSAVPKKETLPAQTRESNTSVLFDIDDEEPLPRTNTTDAPNQNKKGALNCSQFLNVMSPEKSFSKPPRRSYDRKSLEVSKRKFIEEFAGGYPTTDTDTEYEDPDPPHIRKRKKKLQKENENGDDPEGKTSKTAPTKTYKRTKTKESKENQHSPNEVSNSDVKKINNRKGRKKQSGSADDWISDINSHFSEIDELDLVVE